MMLDHETTIDHKGESGLFYIYCDKNKIPTFVSRWGMSLHASPRVDKIS